MWVKAVAGEPLPTYLGCAHKFDYEGLCVRKEVQKGHTGKAPV